MVKLPYYLFPVGSPSTGYLRNFVSLIGGNFYSLKNLPEEEPPPQNSAFCGIYWPVKPYLFSVHFPSISVFISPSAEANGTLHAC